MSERRRLRDNWGASEWSAYIREGQGRSVAGIIEQAGRLREAYAAFKREPQKWGAVRWEKWARDLGYSPATLSMMQTIDAQFGGKNFNDVKAILPQLPASWGSLYYLAQLRRERPNAFDAAITSRRITPSMTRVEAQELLYQCYGKKDPRQVEESARAQRRAEAEAKAQERRERWQNMSAEERQRESQARWEQQHENFHKQHKGFWQNFNRERFGGSSNPSTGNGGDQNQLKQQISKLAKILGRFGSDNDNEVVVAAREADKLRQKMGVNWSDILTIPKRKADLHNWRPSAATPSH